MLRLTDRKLCVRVDSMKTPYRIYYRVSEPETGKTRFESLNLWDATDFASKILSSSDQLLLVEEIRRKGDLS